MLLIHNYVMIQRLVRGVLKGAAQQRYKLDIALRHVKHTASVFRTEERRKV